MNKLTPQTVYVNIFQTDKEGDTYDLFDTDDVKELKDQYVFSKEELIELLNKTWECGFSRGYSIIASHLIKEEDAPLKQEEYINKILNQQ